MGRNRTTICKRIIRLVLLFVSFVAFGLAFGHNQRASAAFVDMPGLDVHLWYTANGNDTPIISLKSTSGPLIYMHSLNVDKYKDLVAHYEVTNNTGKTQGVEPILDLPMWSYYPDRGYPTSLIFDSSRTGELKGATENNQGGGQFNLFYSYDKSTYVPTLDSSKTLYAVMYNSKPSVYTNLVNKASISVSVPLKLITDDYPWDQPSRVPFAGISDMTFHDPYNEFQSRAIWITPYRSPQVKDFTSADYNTLINSDKYNGITMLLNDQTGQQSTRYSVPIEEPDHTKATVDSITPTNTPGEYTVTYTYNGVTKSVKATTTNKSYLDGNDFTVNYGSNWDSQKFNGLTKHLDASGNAVTPLSKDVTISSIKVNGQTVNSVDTSNAGATYEVTYSINGASKTVKVTVGNRGATPVTPTHPVNPNPITPGNNNWNPTTPNKGDGSTGLPNYAAVKGSAVYSVKKIYMYKHATFKKSQRIAMYPKVKRINRPMFVIVGYDRSNGGALRYKVRDVNHGTKNAGKVGYITASRKYVLNVYYKTMPKNNKITVISKNGVHAYKNKNLTGKTKSYKKGTRLKVKKLIKHNLTTRYQLSNGYYVTANKKLVIHEN
ncbi:bacterial Ig-like domain (group 3) [Lentilactobacillus sunkii]|jgi:hypothetical protein|uniref:Bacterial Ig-like domain (Group 3) n=1 Tax=Lentilactobacillus sunkii TaxID=481719 RepID=A0A1E7X9M8_9LACO|nr:DUF5776 domain-containing protein [Lentilactobacillus sunkii]OFA09769.1 bacterial Ig-like domain (group 3) [Lentilactobacillus sunkii]